MSNYIGIGRWWPPYDEPSLLVLNLQFFLVGMLIYESGRRRSPLFAAAAMALMLWSSRGAGFAPALLILIVASLAALWTLGTPRPLLRALQSRVVTFLSDTSYSVYLFHGVFLCIPGAAAAKVLAPYGPGAVTAGLLCIVVPGTYALAYIVFRTVELSGNNVGKRLTGSRDPVAPPMT